MGQATEREYEPGAAVEFRRSTVRQAGLGSWEAGVYVARLGAFIVIRTRWGNEMEVAPVDVRTPRTRVRKPCRPAALPKTGLEPIRDEAYLAFVRDQPCMFCMRAAPSDPHHVGLRGIGQKTDDLRCAPLCRRCHDLYHEGKWSKLLDVARIAPVDGAEMTTVAMHIARAQVDLLVEYFGRRT